MGRIVVTAMVFSMIFCAGEVGAEMALSLGIETAGRQTVGGWRSDDVDTGFSLGLEWRHQLTTEFQFSLGVETLLNRQVDDGSSIQLWAAYAGARWNPFTMRSLYLTGRVGYGYLDRPDILESGGGQSYIENTRGGVCGAAGVGYDLNQHFSVEVLLTLYTGRVETSGGGYVGGGYWADFDSSQSYRYRALALRALYSF